MTDQELPDGNLILRFEHWREADSASAATALHELTSWPIECLVVESGVGDQIYHHYIVNPETDQAYDALGAIDPDEIMMDIRDDMGVAAAGIRIVKVRCDTEESHIVHMKTDFMKTVAKYKYPPEFLAAYWNDYLKKMDDLKQKALTDLRGELGNFNQSWLAIKSPVP